MSHSNKGIVKAFQIDASASADRKVGQLVRITPGGKATNVMGDDNLLYLPLTEDMIVTDSCNYAKSEVASAQVTGIANVYVEESSGITAGIPVGPGATGVGVQQAQTGEFILGIALETPAGDGDMIPVLLAPISPTSSIY